MQQDKNQQSKPNSSQQANPERLASSDEIQRTQQEQKDNKQEIPVGNERNEKTDTQGSQAGMGE